eukprot:scaffold19997_cov84-Cyclotella_meneghiniana.AAC.4
MDEAPPTTEEETPCDSNDANILLYSSLLDDDTFTFDLLPCRNDTITGVINDENEFLLSGGGGESTSSGSGVESTAVPSRTTEAMDADAWEEYLWGWQPTSTTEATVSTSTEAVMEEDDAEGMKVEDVFANGSTQNDGADNEKPSSSGGLDDALGGSSGQEVSINDKDESTDANTNQEVESGMSSQINEASTNTNNDQNNASVEGSSQGSDEPANGKDTTVSEESEVTVNGEEESAKDGTNNELESSGSTNESSQTEGTIKTNNEDDSKDESAGKDASATNTTLHQTTLTESTFYTCHPDPTSLQSGELSPDDTSANKYEIAFDYELITITGDVDLGNTVTELENVMTEGVANQFGLVDCNTDKVEKMMLRRRNLRNKRTNDDGVVALDSDPVDKVSEGQSCTTDVTEEDTICTPVRGYMTVWSENDDVSSVLQSIESGMKNGSYPSDNVVKMVYMGVPNEEELQTETADVTIDTNAAQAIDDSPDSSSSMSIFLPVGISIFALVLACLAIFIIRRRKHNDRNGPKPDQSEPLQSQLQAPPTMDLDDDINLLPSTEKIDMRPINDTDSDTESAGAADEGDKNAPMKEVDVEECSVETSVKSDKSSVQSGSESGSGDLSVFSDEEEESLESGSGLAAIGVASTLASRRVGSPDSMT